MRILVATEETQGQRKSDFCFVPEEEIVTFALECDGELIDGPCGCRRSMTGVMCLTGTTTFKVKEVPDEDLVAVIRGMYVRGGWAKLAEPGELDAWTAADAAEIIRIAEYFPVGAVLEKRGDKFARRKT